MHTSTAEPPLVPKYHAIENNIFSAILPLSHQQISVLDDHNFGTIISLSDKEIDDFTGTYAQERGIEVHYLMSYLRDCDALREELLESNTSIIERLGSISSDATETVLNTALNLVINLSCVAERKSGTSLPPESEQVPSETVIFRDLKAIAYPDLATKSKSESDSPSVLPKSTAPMNLEEASTFPSRIPSSSHSHPRAILILSDPCCFFDAVLVGCIRRMQGWSMMPILFEFRKIAGSDCGHLEKVSASPSRSNPTQPISLLKTCDAPPFPLSPCALSLSPLTPSFFVIFCFAGE